MRNLKHEDSKAGIGIEEDPCSRCGGKGSVIRADPLDLRRVREKAGISKHRLSQLAGKSVSFIVAVETSDPETGKGVSRCPEDLLELYIKMGQGKLAGESSVSEKAAKAYVAAGGRLAEWQRRRSAANPAVKKGQVWEKGGNGKGEIVRVEILHREGRSALVRRWDKGENGAPYLLALRTLGKDYRDVTQEARG